MRKDRKSSGAMIIVAFLVMMTGAILTEMATGNVSGATKVDLYAGDVTTNSVRLTWTETEDLFFDHYELYIDDGSGWRLLKTFQSKYTLESKITGLDSGTEYAFKIRDVDSFGYQDSDIVHVTTESGFLGLSTIGVVSVVLLVLVIAIVHRRPSER